MSPRLSFDDSLQRLQFIYSCCGLILESRKVTPKTKLKNRCVYLLNFFWLNTDVAGALYWLIDGIRSGLTIVELTYNAPCTMFSFVANTKALFIILYENHISDLIDDLRKLEIRYTDEEVIEDILKEDTKFLHRIITASNVLNTVLMATFTLSPVILIALNYYRTEEVKLILPFLIIYPFDSHDIMYWPFVFAHQFWSLCLVLLNFCGADYLLYICCTHLRIQFRFLHHDIEMLVEGDCVLSERDLRTVQSRLTDLIKWHQELIRLAGILELIYAKSTLCNFICSSILICLTGFNVVAIDNVAFNLSFLAFLSVLLLQIFLICFFGDLLMISSIEVSDAIYQCKWHLLSTSAGKNLLIVQTRAQKPCKLTAFGFSDVNLRSFMSILSSAWSYFALLKTVYNPARN